ncbi:MAG: trigger factor [bacterium]|nr:trigger factor [bacterium]
MSDKSPNNVKRLKGARVECELVFDTETVAAAEKKAIEKLGSNLKIEGFREGKAPADMMKDKIPEQALFEETVHLLLPEAIEKLIVENEIKPIIPPKIEATIREPLTLKVTFVERPDVKMKGIDKIKVEKKEAKVEEKDFQRMIDYVTKQHQTSTEVDRPAKETDSITMDFHAEDKNGKEIPEIRTEGHQAVIGSKVLIPGFEDELKGVKKGDKKSFTLSFPEKHQTENLRNQPVTFHVSITKVEEVNTPELTDEFAKTHLHAESVPEFKKQVKESMKMQEDEAERARREQDAMEQIRKATTVELAPELLEEEERQIYEEFRQQLERQGMTQEDWLKRTGKTLESASKELKEQAEKRLTLRLGLQAVIDQKEVSISDEEMTASIDAMMLPLGEEEQKRIRLAYEKGQNPYEQLKWQKKVEKLIATLVG